MAACVVFAQVRLLIQIHNEGMLDLKSQKKPNQVMDDEAEHGYTDW
jgi:hypothetical protein